MMVLVSYDVSTRDDAGRRRLRRVARLCEDHGQRVQKSVFECLVDAAQWVVLRASLLSEADTEQDSLRFYFLGTEWKRRVEHVGTKVAYDPEGPLIL
jgi:CRISPR-associated protein Cas2